MSTRKVSVGAKAMLNEMKRSKRGLIWKGALRARPQPAKFTTYKKERPKEFSAPKN